MTAFSCGAAGAQNIETLLILRFWAGAFGSSPLTNAAGVIADGTSSYYDFPHLLQGVMKGGTL